jgi:hypothetical protein
MYFNDITLLYENISLIESNIDSLSDIPNMDKRMEYKERLENTISDVLTGIKVEKGYALLRYDHELYLIRRLPIEVYKMAHLPSIIIDTGYFDEYTQIASYCPVCDFRPLIRYLRELGYAAGGGKHFIGIIVSNNEDVERLLDKIISLFH